MNTNRSLATGALAASTFVVWLAAVSACGGGGGAASSENAADPDAAPAPEGSPSDEAPSAPDEPDGAQSGVPNEGGIASGDDAGPAMDPSAPDNGPELQRPTGEGSDTSAIAGFWDYSRTTDAGTDAVFVEIGPSGGVTEYDYQGDALGSGEDCHTVLQTSIASRGNDRYDIGDASTLPGSRSGDDVLITADAAEIVFRYLGSVDDPQLSGQLAGVTERYPAVAGRSAEELSVCDDG